MTSDQSAAIQAYAAVAQALFASFAIAVAVGVPIWQQRQASKVKLTVTPKLVWMGQHGFISQSHADVARSLEKHGKASLGIEVVNGSKFEIIIDEVGLCEGDPGNGARMLLNNIIYHPNRAALPRTMRPMSSVQFLFDSDYSSYSFTTRTKAYVSTATNGHATGTSPAFIKLISMRGRVDPWLSA